MSNQPAQKTTSEEVDQRHLDLAREEGDAYQKSLEHMAEDVAHAGATQQIGDYIVGFAQEEAEGMYELRAEGEFEWVEPDDENCHLEVAVSDAADGRFVPYASIRATLVSEDGEEIGPLEVPYVWHPGLHHYGTNLKLPGDGTYDIRVHIDPPEFKRHDKQNGDRYGQPVEVVFENVDIKTGQS